MMRTRKIDDAACDTIPGFGCILTGKSLDSKGRTAQAAKKLNKESRKYNWIKL